MLWGVLGRLGVFIPALIASASVAACSGEDEEPFDCTVMPTCDIAQPACQARVFSATACARGQTGASMPPIRSLTGQEAAAELRQQIDSDPNPPPDPLQKALKLLRLIPDVPLGDLLIDSFVTNVVAYYDPEAKRVTLIADSAVDPGNARFVLSHEFVHALQDQAVDLIAFQRRATSTDDGVAIDTLTEGEAMIHPNMLLARLYRANLRNVDWDSYVRDMRTSAFEVIDHAPAPFIDAMQVLPYPVGFRFLLGPWLDGGQRAIDDLYQTPLLSFGQWAYADGPGQLRATDPLACFPTSPPPGFSGFDHDRLGVTGLIGLRVALGTTAALAFDTAATLEDDSLVVFTAADPAQTVAVAWRLRFNADSAASSLVEAIRRAPGGEFDRLLVEIVDQREVLIRAMSDPALLTGWTTGADCGRAEDLPLPPERAEAPSALSRRVLRWRGARR